MMKSPTKSALSSDIEINSPAAGSHQALTDLDEVCVSGEVLAKNVTEVWAQVFRLGDTVPSSPDTTIATQLTLSNNAFHGRVPGAVKTALTGNSDNKVAVFPKLGSGNSATWGEREVATFVGRYRQENVDVNATACIWFAFTGTSPTIGPWGEVIANHRPPGITIPENATTVTFSATTNVGGETKWRNHPKNGGDPNGAGPAGRDPTIDHKSQYKDASYNSDNINGTSQKLCALVGLKQTNTASPAPTAEEFLIGDNLSNSPLAGVVKLFLGFHDGYEWNNNSGVARVTMTWNLADCTSPQQPARTKSGDLPR